jgi:hypothetical protein
MESLTRPDTYPTPVRATANLFKAFRHERQRRKIRELVDELPAEARSEDGRVGLVSDRQTGQTIISIHGDKGPASFDEKTIIIQKSGWRSVADIRMFVAYADDMGVRTHTNEYAHSFGSPTPELPPEVGALTLREAIKDIRFAQKQITD